MHKPTRSTVLLYESMYERLNIYTYIYCGMKWDDTLTGFSVYTYIYIHEI